MLASDSPGRLAVQLVSDPDDDKSVRLDGTYGSMRLGNWLLTAGGLDRWWGPGWDGSLLLSNNARPIPAIALDRESSRPFESKWLSWIGPWRFSTFMGRMEEHREDRDHPWLFGTRLSFRPFANIKIGSVHPFRGFEFALERTAQWCAEGLALRSGCVLARAHRQGQRGCRGEPGGRTGKSAWAVTRCAGAPRRSGSP